jgi:hypothetical protein
MGIFRNLNRQKAGENTLQKSVKETKERSHPHLSLLNDFFLSLFLKKIMNSAGWWSDSSGRVPTQQA